LLAVYIKACYLVIGSLQLNNISNKMENRIMKVVDRLPEGFIRTFLEDNVKYSSAVIAVATGYFVASVSTINVLVKRSRAVTDWNIQRLYRVYLGPTSAIPGNFIDNFFNLPMIYYNLPLGKR
jgi:hypothetical protein